MDDSNITKIFEELDLLIKKKEQKRKQRNKDFEELVTEKNPQKTAFICL